MLFMSNLKPWTLGIVLAQSLNIPGSGFKDFASFSLLHCKCPITLLQDGLVPIQSKLGKVVC